jgi:DNA adenine methylase
LSAALVLTPPLQKAPISVLRWVGSKQWLAASLVSQILPRLSASGVYYEPFLGGASVYLRLRAHGFEGKAVLSDRLRPLIRSYCSILTVPQQVIQELDARRGTIDEWDYYAVRHAFNLLEPQLTDAPCPAQTARFLYLNYKGFNGLWRQNRFGDMSTPYGGEVGRELPPSTLIYELQQALATTELRCCDFSGPISEAKEGDVIYADPPYEGTYQNYAGSFTASDQGRLRNALRKAYERGVTIIASNSDTPTIRTLYKDFRVESINVQYRVGGIKEKRKEAQELLVSSLR